MKLSQTIIPILLLIFFNAQVLAEGSGKGGDEFRQTAKKYDMKSQKYQNKGMSDVAALYARQAEIKREAARLGDQGRWNEIDWSEYHANEGLINEKVQQAKKSHKTQKKTAAKKGGDGFRQAAQEYDNKSAMYRSKGMSEVASLYSRQADIKEHAAGLADKGLWDEIDWTEYYANESRINKLLSHGANKHAKK